MKRILTSTSSSFLAVFALACAASEPATSSAPQTKSEVAATATPALAQRHAGGVATLAPPVATEATSAAVIARVIELARTDNHVQDHLRHLCLDIGPRLTSSHNLATAEQWAFDQFRSWGLEAKLEPWGEFPIGFDRGALRGQIIGDPTPLEFTTMAWTPGTNGPTRGPVFFKPQTEEQLAELGDRLRGAWLLPPRTYENAEDKPKVDKETRDKVTAAIAAAGIAGEIRGVRGETVITDGRPGKITWDNLPKNPPQVLLRGSQFKDLVARVEKGEPVEVEFDIGNHFYAGPVQQFNVIADIKGSEFPDQFVIVGGHLDSWDGAQGAVDNGTGSATTLEAARLLAASGAQPKRTIRFALWSGEEQGLFGSTGYVRDHADELDRISAVFIHDEGTNYLSGLGVTIDMEAQMRTVCAPLFGLNPELPFELRVTDGFRYSPDSDHAPFAAKGVPGFFWDQAGKSDYNHMHHTQYDTFETAVPEYQEHSALVVALTAFNTANLPSLLSRENFKAPEPRRMGVDLDVVKIRTLTKGGLAEKAGWKVGDVIQSVDGVAVTKRKEVTDELQKGGPRKVFVLLRGESEKIESTLDYTDDPDEKARAERLEMRAARKSAQQKKFW
ncbi:MAG TPA: M20/M25/M40 family metallo-hydrolase [Planctomycetota bacterium]|nr:M20/M25/M40 family metallo-hydrolase [Planctomycetota bacterium]